MDNNVGSILFLNGNNLKLIPSLLHVKAKVVTEDQFGNSDEYTADPPFLRSLRKLQGDQFSLIILGHNAGAGLVKAKAIPAECRLKTHIISSWDLITPDRGAYVRLGYPDENIFTIWEYLRRENIPVRPRQHEDIAEDD